MVTPHGGDSSKSEHLITGLLGLPDRDYYHGCRLWANTQLEFGHGNTFINIVIEYIELVIIKMYSGPVPALACMSFVGRFISI